MAYVNTNVVGYGLINRHCYDLFMMSYIGLNNYICTKIV